ncbi:MAG: YbjN domain-containing protein [Lachnospiraceae bacterium]|nr:YbjN domain-containing protein [Lachnospiraceae bacterium]
MEKRKLEILQMLETDLRENWEMGEMSIFNREELNVPVDLLRVEIPGFGADLVSVLGEFFFLPFEDTEVLFFSSVITLTTQLPSQAVTDVLAGIARLNYYLPCGCFALGDDDKILVYRFTVPIVGEEDIEKQYEDASIAVDTAITTAETFEGQLKLLIKGDITVEDLIYPFKQGN